MRREQRRVSPEEVPKMESGFTSVSDDRRQNLEPSLVTAPILNAYKDAILPGRSSMDWAAMPTAASVMGKGLRQPWSKVSWMLPTPSARSPSPPGGSMRYLLSLWYRQCRRIDLKILWPICKEKARDSDHAKATFAMHAFNDPAWLFLGENEIKRQIDAL